MRLAILTAFISPGSLRTLLPVLGVPIDSSPLQGLDALLSTVQMPAGIPVGTLAIGKPGAKNAGLLAGAILARKDPAVRAALARYRARQTDAVPTVPDALKPRSVRRAPARA